MDAVNVTARLGWLDKFWRPRTIDGVTGPYRTPDFLSSCVELNRTARSKNSLVATRHCPQLD